MANLDYVELFKHAKNHEDLAKSLQCKVEYLRYLVYSDKIENKYSSFNLERSYKIREINAPNKKLKVIQLRISRILNEIYSPPKCVHGFLKGKSIITNAKPHLKAQFILKLDIKDFFSTIHFGRVKGLFEASPFNFAPTNSILLARLCCFNATLPQGASTSPIIANMICRKLDKDLIQLARRNNCRYTRYADDITFSSDKPFTHDLLSYEDNTIKVSKKLHDIFIKNSFQINENKVNYLSNTDSKYITGIKVNIKLNTSRKKCREVRAMLHAYEKFGAIKALEEHLAKFTHRKTTKPAKSFLKIIQGKIAFLEMVKGKNDPLILKFKSKLIEYKLIEKKTLKAKEKNLLSRVQELYLQEAETIIFTEGKTDILHLTYALKQLRNEDEFKSFNPYFYYFYHATSGDSCLKNNYHFTKKHDRVLLHNANLQNKRKTTTRPHQKIVYILDRDCKVKNYLFNNGEYPNHIGYNSWTFTLPIPSFRTELEGDSISIEHYYPNSFLLFPDDNERRIFLKNEFDENKNLITTNNNGEKVIDTAIKYKEGKKCDKAPFAIIDDEVIKTTERSRTNIALSKHDMALRVISGELDYPTETLESFRNLFRKIKNLE